MAGLQPLRGDHLLHLKQRMDYVSATRILYGIAAPGTATSAAGWQIRQETLDSQGRTTAIDFAGGTPDLNQVWDNRLSLAYS